MPGSRQHVHLEPPQIFVDPVAFRADTGPSRAQVFQPRRMSVDSSSSNIMSNLNNFQPIYDTNKPYRPCPRPRPLYVDLNAPVESYVYRSMDQPTNPIVCHPVDQPRTENVYILMMDELFQTPPQDPRVGDAIAPGNWNFDWSQVGSSEPWFHESSHPSIQGEVPTAAVVAAGQDEGVIDERGNDDEEGERGEGNNVGEGGEEGEGRQRRGFGLQMMLRQVLKSPKKLTLSGKKKKDKKDK